MRGLPGQPELAVIIPSTGRAEQCAQLVNRIHETSTIVSDIVVSVEPEDLEPYTLTLAVAGDSVKIVTPEYPPETRSHVAAINRGARWLVGEAPFDDDLAETYPAMLVKMDDDHWPHWQRPSWDRCYLDALAELGGTGIVYGNDLFQCANLPTVPGISTNIVRELGWFAPPQLGHLFCDNFWLELGRRAGCLTYLPDTIIEHRHPAASKAKRDAVYDLGGESRDRWDADQREWNRIISGRVGQDGNDMDHWSDRVRRLAERRSIGD